MEFAQNVKEIGDKIVNLSMLDAKMLSDYLKSAYGLEEAVETTGPAIEVKPVDMVQATFDVVLTVVGEKKINVIKVIRTATGLGLKESKDLVEALPKTIKEGLDKVDAEKLKKLLEVEGATVELK